MSDLFPKVVVATFYHFTSFSDYQNWRKLLMDLGNTQGLKGTILLAPEGINGTIAGSRGGIDALLQFLRADARLHNLEHKESYCTELPFQRLKVRLKTEIVKLGISEIDPNQKVGTYVEPQDWNAVLENPEVVVIDTRNIYEVEVGSFVGAVNPNLKTFSEFPEYVERNLDKNQKVAMFCTGGIRCEKASAYLLSQGFGEVYHLKGGILKYLEEVAPQSSLWQGQCFVFDDRRSVNHDTYKLP